VYKRTHQLQSITAYSIHSNEYKLIIHLDTEADDEHKPVSEDAWCGKVLIARLLW